MNKLTAFDMGLSIVGVVACISLGVCIVFDLRSPFAVLIGVFYILGFICRILASAEQFGGEQN